MKRCLLLMLVFLALQSSAHAQKALFEKRPHVVQKVYWSTNMDGMILSTALLKDGPNSDFRFTTPRFTAFLHLGTVANFDFNRHVGVFAGLNMKNIGFIEKFSGSDSTVIRRAYTFGIPLGLKVGNLYHGNYILLGGGVDFPFNYKEKGFVKRSRKEKFNEWFGMRTPALMPYAFFGAHLRPGVVFKLQYYPLNFLNQDYVDKNGLKPYQNYEVNLCMLTLGFDFTYRPKHGDKKTYTSVVD